MMKKGYSLLLVVLIVTSLYIVKPQRIHSIEPFFTLVFKTNGGGVRPDYGYLLKDQLARIGINLDVIILDWPTFVGELIAWRDFDICYVDTSGRVTDPALVGWSNGLFNLFGYHTSMDWDEELGTGINEWYLREGTQIMPPNSQERIQHYWDWEQYLMDKILPCQPTFTPKTYMAYWGNLKGYNYSEGILQSWGKLSWDGSHTGQVNTNEIVISDLAWADLMPIFYHDSASDFVVKACYDPLFWYDEDQTVWPHLAESFTMLNDTWVRITARQGIKWQNDSGSLFTDEYFDIHDVYFTLYCLKYVSNDPNWYSWIDDMEIIDKWTMDIHIDGNSDTPERESYYPFLSAISTDIIPEHFLNQTQLPDGVTPDVTHHSWNSIKTECIGTGLFSLTNYSIGLETNLQTNPESWWTNETITSDPNLNWEARFGDFSGGINQLRIRIIPERQISLLEFEAGKIDLQGFSTLPVKRLDSFCCFPFNIQSKLTWSFGFFGYNMREVRPFLGNRQAAPGNQAITIGLCIRKAISYAMDREEMNNIIHGGEMAITNHPIYQKLGVWCNPDIIQYNHNLNKAIEYMRKTSIWGGWTPPVSISIFSIFGGIIAVFTATSWIIKVKKKESRKQLK